jgi:hypothetical protein
MIVLIAFFVVISLFGIKNINDGIIKIAFAVHSLSILLFFILQKLMFYENILSYDEPIALIILVHIFLTIFLLFFNFNFFKKVSLESKIYFSQIQIVSALILFYIIFFFSVFESYESVFEFRTGIFNKEFFLFDVLRFFLISLVTFNLVMIFKRNIFLKKLVYILLFLIGLSLMMSFGSRNNLVYLVIAFVICVIRFKRYKFLIFLLPFIILFNFITLNRDAKVKDYNISTNSLGVENLFFTLDNLKTYEKIYYQADLFHSSRFPTKLFYDFYIGIIPKTFFNFFGVKKDTHITFIDWNNKNVSFGNETPSYIGQIILQSGLLGLIFFPINFLLIIIPHSIVFTKILSFTDSTFHITFLSLFIGGIFNITRMISFSYLAPFWFLLIFVLILKKWK